MAVQLFSAGRVTWVTTQPTGRAGDTIWPDMDWIETLVLDEDAAGEIPLRVCLQRVAEAE